MNVLVTGATGFIGKHLVEDLKALNKYNIFCLVRNLKKAEALKVFGVKLIHADISDEASLQKVLNFKIDLIFHCAGYVENKNPHLLHKINVIGTRNICELALKLSVKRLVYLSSVAVVSGNNQPILKEDMPYSAPNVYGKSKIEAEKKVLSYREKGLPVVIIRPCVVYGEAEPHLMKFLLGLIKFRLFRMLASGQNKFPLVYVKNVTALMLAALESQEYLEGTFFITDKETLTMRENFDIAAKALGAKESLAIPGWLKSLLLNFSITGRQLKFFLKDRTYSLEHLERVGFNPPYSVREGLTKTVKWFLEN